MAHAGEIPYLGTNESWEFSYMFYFLHELVSALAVQIFPVDSVHQGPPAGVTEGSIGSRGSHCTEYCVEGSTQAPS